MPKRAKDFTYYADKAEEQIRYSEGQHTAETKDRFLRRAELYVRLAAAAPKPIIGTMIDPEAKTGV